MEDSFVARHMLIRIGEEYHETIILIENPVPRGDGDYNARVVFSNVSKYDAIIKGADSLNAVECAISYINGICQSSTDPRFYWDDGSPFVGSG